MKYQLNDTFYATKKQVTDTAIQFFGPWKPNREPLTGEARSFFLSLLKQHDGWKRKTQGRSDDEIHLKPEYMGIGSNQTSYGLRLYFGNDMYRGDDISWRHAVTCLKRVDK